MLDSILSTVSTTSPVNFVPVFRVGETVRVSRSIHDQRDAVDGTVCGVERDAWGGLTVRIVSTPEQSATRDGLAIVAVWKPGYAWLVAHREAPLGYVGRKHTA